MNERIVSPVNIKPNKAQRNKTKSDKKKFYAPYSILEVHQTQMEYFDKLQKSLPSKIKELKVLEKEYDKTKSRGIKINIDDLKKEIDDIKEKKEELDYHSKTAIILTHYENLMNMKSDDQAFFTQLCDDYYTAVGMMDRVSGSSLTQEKCVSCDCDAEYEDIRESYCICTNCGLTETITRTENPAGKELENYSVIPVHFDYKRLTHLNDCLNQAQGKENTDIPQEIMDIIILQLRRERIYDLKTLTNTQIRNILKKTGNSKYYEHIPYILGNLTGKYKVFPEEMIEKITAMFEEIQGPFEKHKPKERKNFLSYKYCCYKLCELLGYDEFLECFDLLKSREKLRKQDEIWKKICEDLRWEYISTI
jgi:hypothetical protein